MRFISSLVVVGISAVLVLLFVGNLKLSSKLEYQAPLTFEVSSGEGFNLILREIRNLVPEFPEKTAKIYLKLTGNEQNLKLSEYEIPKDKTTYEILKILMKGQVIQRKVTIQEGFNIYQIAQILESRGLTTAEEFITKCKDPVFIEKMLGYLAPSVEGYLFPDTYRLPKKWNAEQYIEHFIKRHFQVWEEVVKSYPADKSHHQAVILASMIEKETGAGFERPMISSVFHNRLKKAMRLQSDPTTIYGVWVQTGKMKKNITRKDLTTSTPYNTYTVRGLPFGPIANPGREALKASIQPAVSNNYYFVSKNDGTHQFSRTYDQHLAAVRKYQLDAKAREGKSWRDLKQ